MNQVFHFLLTFSCFSILVWQSWINIEAYLEYPTAQRISTKRDVGKNFFPKIEACLSPGYDMDYLRSQGYSSLGKFVKGIGSYEGKIFYGWNGHKGIGIDDLFESASLFKTFNSVVKMYELQLDNKNMTEAIQIRERKFRYPDGKCFDFKFRITSKDKHKVEGRVAFLLKFHDLTNSSIFLRITDPYREYFLSDVFTFSGSEIRKSLDPDEGNIFDIYKIQIRKNVHRDDDIEVNCKEYDTGGKDGFKDCVQSLVSDQYQKEFGCIPPWFTDNISQMCNKTTTKTKGVQISDTIFPKLDQTFLQVCIYSSNFCQAQAPAELEKVFKARVKAKLHPQQAKLSLIAKLSKAQASDHALTG